MSVSDTANLFTGALDKIAFYWHFFVGTILVLTGWLVSAKARPSSAIRRLVAVGYLIFAGMNVLGLWGAYTFAEALKEDLTLQLQADTGDLPHTLDALKSMWSFRTMKWVAICIHIIGLIMVYVILFRVGRLSTNDGRRT